MRAVGQQLKRIAENLSRCLWPTRHRVVLARGFVRGWLARGLRPLGLGLCLVAGMDSTAQASTETQPSESRKSSPSPRELFAQVRRHYELGQFAQALEVLRQGCGSAQYEGCEYNLGVIEQSMEHCPEATAHYRRYLERHPGGAHRIHSAQALSYLGTLCQVPESTNPADRPTEQPPRSTQREATPRPATPEPLGPGNISPKAGPPSGKAGPSIPPPVEVTPASGPAPPTSNHSLPEPSRGASLVPAADTAYLMPFALYALGGVSAATAAYGGTRLVLSNRAIQQHRDSPNDGQQEGRFNRATRYRTLALASGAGALLCVGAALALQWPLGSSSQPSPLTVGLYPSVDNHSARLVVDGVF